MAYRIVCLHSRVSVLSSRESIPGGVSLAEWSAHAEHVACISLGMRKTNDQFEGIKKKEKKRRQKGQMERDYRVVSFTFQEIHRKSKKTFQYKMSDKSDQLSTLSLSLSLYQSLVLRIINDLLHIHALV